MIASAMRALPIALLVLLTSTARADERAPKLGIGWVFAVHSLPESTAGGDDIVPQVGKVADELHGPRLVLGFERAPLPYPEQRGYNVDVQLVPELVAGAFLDDQKAEGMLGVGLRGELRISQREMGLLRVSARCAIYLAARALVVGEHRDPFGELVFGEYFLLGDRARIGFELGAMVRREDAMVEATRGMVGQLYVGGSL